MVINRAGLGREEPLQRLAEEYGVGRVFRIPYSRGAVQAYVQGRPVAVAYPDDPASRALVELADAVEGEVLRGRGGVG